MSRFEDRVPAGDYGVHVNPSVGRIFFSDQVSGRRLRVGETIHEDDLYASSSGRWERVPCPGLVVQEG